MNEKAGTDDCPDCGKEREITGIVENGTIIFYAQCASCGNNEYVRDPVNMRERTRSFYGKADRLHER